MSLFGRWSELHRFDSIDAARQHFNVGDGLWQAFTTIVGNFQDDLRLLSAFPRMDCCQVLAKQSYQMAEL